MTRICSALVFCAALLFSHSIAQAQASLKNEPSFAATGLLAFPGETAEDILFRAHAYDSEAIVLASIGYCKGLHGFPHDPGLALAWSQRLLVLGNAQAAALTAFLATEEMLGAEEAEQQMKMCLGIKDNPLVDVLRTVHIADVGASCARLRKTIPEKSMEAISEKAETLWHKGEQSSQETVPLIRSLLTRKATEADLQKMEDVAFPLSPTDIVFLVVTTHNPASGKPDPSPERLMRFLMAQKKSTAPDELVSALIKAPDMLAYLGGFSPELKEAARLAHSGDYAAMRVLAESYAYGTHGVPLDITMNAAWLRHAAFTGDSMSMLSLAIQDMEQGNRHQAWAWADMLASEKIQKADATSKKMAQDLRTKLEATMDEKDKATGRQNQAFLLQYMQSHGKKREKVTQ